MRTKDEQSVIDFLYHGTMSIQEFCYDNLTTIPILSLLTNNDIGYLRKIILSPRYAGNGKLRIKKIDELMHYRGFTKFAGGTNRIVYTHPSAPGTVFKVAIDSVGITDNPAEFKNQNFLKPYCCKVFECSPCGTIASFEQVDRISTFDEFYSIADDYFYLLSRVILGKYVMEDIGINYFMNFGIRRGFGVVILDYPYLFELDGGKLRCSALQKDTPCSGEVDYDYGFNKLVCQKCGKSYHARDLAKSPEQGGILICDKKGNSKMRICISRGKKVIQTVETGVETDHFEKPVSEVTTSPAQTSTVKIKIMRGNKCVDESIINRDERPDDRMNPIVLKRVENNNRNRSGKHNHNKNNGRFNNSQRNNYDNRRSNKYRSQNGSRQAQSDVHVILTRGGSHTSQQLSDQKDKDEPIVEEKVETVVQSDPVVVDNESKESSDIDPTVIEHEHDIHQQFLEDVRSPKSPTTEQDDSVSEDQQETQTDEKPCDNENIVWESDNLSEDEVVEKLKQSSRKPSLEDLQ